MATAYRFNTNGFFIGSVDVGVSTILPSYHTFQPPPYAPEGFCAVMRDGWKLTQGEQPVHIEQSSAHEQVPQSVTMRQARLALHAAGLLPAVEAAVAAMPEPDKTAAQITWEFAATVDRGFGMVPQLAAAMGMTDAQIDTLFIEAAKL